MVKLWNLSWYLRLFEEELFAAFCTHPQQISSDITDSRGGGVSLDGAGEGGGGHERWAQTL